MYPGYSSISYFDQRTDPHRYTTMENIEGNKVWENGSFYRLVCSVFNSYSHVRISLRFVSAFFLIVTTVFSLID